jgi:hypothetical protein
VHSLLFTCLLVESHIAILLISFLILKTVGSTKAQGMNEGQHNCLAFRVWLHDKMQEKLENFNDVDKEFLYLSSEPQSRALSYRNMWAFNNHYWVDNGNMSCHRTYNFGIASIFA